jgi:hypothetical protein
MKIVKIYNCHGCPWYPYREETLKNRIWCTIKKDKTKEIPKDCPLEDYK